MNLGHLIDSAARRFATRTALIYGQRRYSFADMAERSNRLANALLGLGLAHGQRVGLLMRNCPEYMQTQFALEKAGLVRVPLNALLAQPEQVYTLQDSGASALVFDRHNAERVAALREQAPQIQHYLYVAEAGEAPPGAWAQPYEQVLQAASAAPPPVEVTLEDLCSLNYTSGTTGRPKGVMLTQRNWMAVYRNMLVDRDIREQDIVAHIGPLTHASGAYFAPWFLRGATNLIVPGSSIEGLLQAIAGERVTVFTCVPTVLTRFINHPDLDRYDLSSLRSVGYGAAPMPYNTIAAALERFGPIFTQNYGQSEAYMTCTLLRSHEHVVHGDPAQVRRLASVGRPYTFVETLVVDDEGRDVAPGDKGELIVRSEHVMQGYWGLPEETAKALRGGWLYTGDVATVDEEGFIFLVDRKKDMVISGGFNIYPREVEDVISAYPGVMEVAVIGMPDPDWGEAIHAYVVSQPGTKVDEAALLAFCKERLAFKRPKGLHLIDSLPKNANGKIAKTVLRQQAVAGQVQ